MKNIDILSKLYDVLNAEKIEENPFYDEEYDRECTVFRKKYIEPMYDDEYDKGFDMEIEVDNIHRLASECAFKVGFNVAINILLSGII